MALHFLCEHVLGRVGQVDSAHYAHQRHLLRGRRGQVEQLVRLRGHPQVAQDQRLDGVQAQFPVPEKTHKDTLYFGLDPRRASYSGSSCSALKVLLENSPKTF